MMSPRAVTKIVQPSRSRPLLHRPRLVDFIQRHLDHKLILISASAGYGKTSLLIDFAHETALPVCWYSLDETDQDPRAFLQYLIVTIHRQFPQVGEEAFQILARAAADHDYDAAVGNLVTEIQENVPDPFVIVLDDFHTIAESNEIRRLVKSLLRYLPEKAHLIISSRTNPFESADFDLMVARQEVAGLGIEELQFTPDEIRALLRQNYQVEPSDQEIADLAKFSEGWIAAILLTTPKLWQGLLQRLIAGRGLHENIFRFLAAEAFACLTSELQHFLLESSVLIRMNVSTCNELLGIQNAAQMLRAVEEQNLFVIRSPEETGAPCFRYHNLFQDFLKQHLAQTDPVRWRELNQRAAGLYEKDSMSLGQAIAHYFAAGMPEDAARVIALIAQSTFDSGHWTTLARWMDALPDEILEAHPQLIAMRGMLYVEAGKNAEAEVAYQRAEEIYAHRGDEVGAAKVVIWRAMLWGLTGRYREAIEASEHVLDTLRRSHSQLEEARAYRILGTAHSHLGLYPQCVEELEHALKLYTALGDDVRVAWLQHEIGTCKRRHGDPSADGHYQAALAFWRRMHHAVGLATTLNNVGMDHHQAGRDAEAIEVLEEACALARESGNHRMEATTLASQGDVYRDQGNLPQALELYRQAQELSQHMDGFIHVYNLVALGETYQLMGQEEPAIDYLQRALKVAKVHRSRYECGLAETAMGIWEYQHSQAAEAIRRFHRAIKLLSTMEHVRARARLHLAQVYLLQKKCREAERQLETMATESTLQDASFIPFITADGKQLRTVLRYAISKKIGEPYYAPALEKVTGQGAKLALSKPVARVRVQVRALGTPRVIVDGKLLKEEWATATTRELFFLLLANPEGLRKEEILEALWPDRSEGEASDLFHSLKSSLRKAVPDCVGLDNRIYFLRPHLELEYDVAQFAAAVERATKAESDSARVQGYEDAIRLYGGNYLSDSYLDWCQGIRMQLRQQYLDALRAVAEIYTRQDDLSNALARYRKYLEVDQDNEEIYRGIMRLQGKQGDRTGVMHTYQQCGQVLEEELGLDGPSRETTELYEQILNGETELLLA